MAGSKDTSALMYDPVQVADAIRENHGLIAVSARKLGCSRRTVYNYLERFPIVREALADAREEMVDRAQSQLVGLVNAGNYQAIRFVLATFGRHHGYRFEQELRNYEDADIEVEPIVELIMVDSDSVVIETNGHIAGGPNGSVDSRDGDGSGPRSLPSGSE